jgi:membrane-bound ClpP family serine protease
MRQLRAQEVEAAAGEGPAAVRRAGWALKLELPIKGKALDRIRRFSDRAMDKARAQGKRPVLVFEFIVPRGQEEDAATTEFGEAYDAANFISSERLNAATTVAYVPQSIRGHAVLVVLACDEIVMAPDAEIGLAGVNERTIGNAMDAAYKEIADRRKRIPAEVALGLLDPSRKVLQVETEVSPEYVSPEGLERLRERRTITSTKVLFDAGQPGRLSGREARDRDFISFMAANRRELARQLELPPEALEVDPAFSEDYRAVRVDLKGPVTGEAVRKAQKMIEQAVRDDMNFVCLAIDSPGGSLSDSLQLASFLAYDLDPSEVRTVAYIASEARADAAIVAWACDQVVMHPGALLGGEGADVFDEREIEEASKTIRDAISLPKSRSWSLPAAIIDPDLEVFRYTRADNPGYAEYFCEDELAEQPDPNEWKKGDAVTVPGKPFEVSGEDAEEYWLAADVVDSFAAFKELYGLEDDPTLLEPGWADFLVDALASPGLAMLLLMIGFVAMYAELQAPGIGVGGFVAAVCFLLFFWSRFLGGTAGWLEVMLFVAGVACLLLEVFVLPGFGIFGLGGGVLILASIILASQTFIRPRNDYQFDQFQNSLMVLAGAAMGTIALAMLVNRWLPKAPIVSDMVLNPPEGDEAEDRRRRESLVEYDELVGQRGTTTTQLTPSGKAMFGDQLLDVITDGEVIDRETNIVVVEVKGNRVLVRAVEDKTTPR